MLDQFTKYLVEEYLISTVPIIGSFFTLEKVHNIGAAWGILGNLIDRILYGYVIDFLSFTFGSYQFPVFNLADMGIVIGIGFLFIEICRGEVYEIRNRRRKR